MNRPVRVRIPTTDLWLCDSTQCDPGSRVSFKNRKLEAMRLLAHWREDVFRMNALRAAARRSGVAVAQCDDAEVVSMYLRWLTTGRFHFCRWSGKLGMGIGVVERAAEAPVEAPELPAQRERTRTAWIEIRLVDEDDKPVPSVAYEIKLPDGSMRRGTLDEEGSAYIGNIDPGECQVSFPDLDARDWRPA
jgi:hypothetical protein